MVEGEKELLACNLELRALHDSDSYGGIINTHIMNKGKLSEASWPLLVKNKEK